MTEGTRDSGAIGRDRNVSSLDTGVAHVARVYNYLLGGKDHFAADRAAADLAVKNSPEFLDAVRANRAFCGRAVRVLAEELGIRQFLDIGTGIPAPSNTHEIAQGVAPESRIVYVDNDPLVLTHARALLTSDPAGITDYIDADLRDPGTILAEAGKTLDLGRPVAVLLLAVLHFIGDEDDPWRIVAALVDAMPPGSCLAISHGATDIVQRIIGEARADSTLRGLNRSVAEQVTLRDREAVSKFFGELELIEPGLVPVSQWRAPADVEQGQPAGLWGAVALKK